MAKIPSRAEIDAAARRLGIAEPDGTAHRRDRAAIVETILAEQQSAQNPEAPPKDTRPTADVLAELAEDLADSHVRESAAARILAAATYTHTARHGVITRKDTP